MSACTTNFENITNRILPFLPLSELLYLSPKISKNAILVLIQTFFSYDILFSRAFFPQELLVEEIFSTRKTLFCNVNLHSVISISCYLMADE